MIYSSRYAVRFAGSGYVVVLFDDPTNPVAGDVVYYADDESEAYAWASMAEREEDEAIYAEFG